VRLASSVAATLEAPVLDPISPMTPNEPVSPPEPTPEIEPPQAPNEALPIDPGVEQPGDPRPHDLGAAEENPVAARNQP
jgi:hypothetical protein